MGKKASGKTTVIENVIKHTKGPNTEFIIISSTADKDPTYVRLIKELSEKHNVNIFTEIVDDDENIVEEFLNQMKQTELEKKQEEAQQKQKIDPQIVKIIKKASDGMTTRDKQIQVVKEKPKQNIIPPKPKEYKPKLVSPDYVFVFDDLSEETRNKYVNKLLKTNRHWHIMNLISSQDLNDLMPSALKQLDVILIFGRADDDKLAEMYKKLKLSLNYNTFLKLYKDATSEPYGFLYINRRGKTDEYRKGFTDKYELDKFS